MRNLNTLLQQLKEQTEKYPDFSIAWITAIPLDCDDDEDDADWFSSGFSGEIEVISEEIQEFVQSWINQQSSHERTLRKLTERLTYFSDDYETELKLKELQYIDDVENLIQLFTELHDFISKNPDLIAPPDSRFYVYGHQLPGENRFFYIGKGTKRRAWSKRRETYWKEYVAKHGGDYEVVIIQEGLAEQDALDIEERLIEKHADFLINLDKPPEGIKLELDFDTILNDVLQAPDDTESI